MRNLLLFLLPLIVAASTGLRASIRGEASEPGEHQNQVECPGYSVNDNTHCDCGGDCSEHADTWCSCEAARECCGPSAPLSSSPVLEDGHVKERFIKPVSASPEDTFDLIKAELKENVS